MIDTDSDLLTSTEAAQRLGVTTQTLTYWRTKRTGPKFVRLGDDRRGYVRYRPADVEAYIAANTVDPKN